MSIRITQADYGNPDHQQAIIDLVNDYSSDSMGRNRPLSDPERERLIPGLMNNPCCFTMLAYDGDRPVGIANCVVGFSTFSGESLVNIHDLAVVTGMRGQGVGALLLHAVEEHARALKCCKVTMEVRTDNPARRLYERHGFGDDEPPMMFWHKKL